jgi:hypothetical protein
VNLGAVLVTGLFAGGISCAAVQGGLLTGLVTRQRGAATDPARRPARRPGPSQEHGQEAAGPATAGDGGESGGQDGAAGPQRPACAPAWPQ